jgi:hypothetical protein
MLDCEITKQMEKRGRFLIQEIEDDYSSNSTALKFTNSDKFKTNLHTVNNSRRTKHSSIIMDSKIFYTTRIESNLSNGSFNSLIYEENQKDWIDFDQIWKKFSKVHQDLCEDDMEKIFQYIDKRIDESDFFCLNSSSNLHSCNVDKNLKFEEKMKIPIENENKLNENFITNTTELIKKTEDNFQFNKFSENEPDTAIDNINEKNVNTENFDANPNKKMKLKSITNKSLFLTNFCEDPFISPAVSPISSNTKIFNFQRNFFERNFDINRHSEKLKTKTMKKLFKEKCETRKENFEVCRNVSFSISPNVSPKRISQNFSISSTNFIVNNQSEIEIMKEIHLDKKPTMIQRKECRYIEEDDRCSICKNKIK